MVWRCDRRWCLKQKPEAGLEVDLHRPHYACAGSSRLPAHRRANRACRSGHLMALIEERKKKLAAEGLFAEARKKTLPFLPDVIGVITSPTGAVLRDIMHRLADRFSASRAALAGGRAGRPLRRRSRCRHRRVQCVARIGRNSAARSSDRCPWRRLARRSVAFNEEIVVRAPRRAPFH